MITISISYLFKIIIILNGGLLAFFITLNEIFKKKNLNQVFFFMCIALLQFSYTITLLKPSLVWSEFIQMFFLFLFGPTLYFYFEKILNAEFYLNRTFFYHLIPAIIYIVAALAFRVDVNDTFVLKFASIPLSILFVLYFIFIEIKLLKFWQSSFSKEISILVILILLDLFTFVVLQISGYWIHQKFIIWAHLLLSFIVFLLFLLNSRFPVFLNNLPKNMRYKKSKIKNLDTNEITLQLNELFEKKKIFLDDSISLEKLAKKTGLAVHQISEFINTHWHISFFNLINRYRIKEAQTMLLEKPEETILNIAYNVGFSNKSSFNSAFKKFTGLTPLKFRSKHFKK